MASSKGSILVTGANGGLGSAIVSHILADPDLAAHHGLYTVRDASAPNVALRTALSSSPTHASSEILSLDLSRLSNVREFAASINKRVKGGEIPPIKALILNAGVLEFEQQTWTSDKEGRLDMTFAANYLAHWLLTLMLLQSMDRERGRVVVVGSAVHNAQLLRNARHYHNDKFIIRDGTDAIAKGTWSSREEDPSYHSGFRRYGASKLCLYMMVTELQRRLSTDPALGGITLVGIDPGSMNTSIARHGNWVVRTVIFPIVIGGAARLLSGFYPNMVMRTPEKSAKDVMNAAMSSERLKDDGGGLYLNGSEIDHEVSDEVNDAAKRAMVWQDSVRYARLEEGETMLVDWK
ncbi:hypothetical protein NLU13_8187 [Sarocladium strictum]|uniref:Short-chain dehydrogenase n=1 Tax=Sarocladium strictum TaxID=5046 RepID=A0AA39GB67_SARSR|nr:hypothetical protein NLU13_8187 [Sarocladium strictum]